MPSAVGPAVLVGARPTAPRGAWPTVLAGGWLVVPPGGWLGLPLGGRLARPAGPRLAGAPGARPRRAAPGVTGRSFRWAWPALLWFLLPWLGLKPAGPVKQQPSEPSFALPLPGCAPPDGRPVLRPCVGLVGGRLPAWGALLARLPPGSDRAHFKGCRGRSLVGPAEPQVAWLTLDPPGIHPGTFGLHPILGLA